MVFFKQKTAYEMRISDWSSDVCSSDLGDGFPRVGAGGGAVGRECFAILGKAAGLAVLPTPRFPEPATPSGRRASAASRSEERRGGKEGVSTCTSRWSPDR